LLDDPSLIRSEIDRRMEAAKNADPRRRREEDLRRERVRLENSAERLVTAYQEELLTLAELRQRMPHLRKQQQAVESELHSLEMAAADQAKYLQLAETLDEFRAKLRVRADTLDVGERQKILRLLVREVLVSQDRITIRHSIPISQSCPGSSGSPSSNTAPGGSTRQSCLLRSGRQRTALRRSLLAPNHHPLDQRSAPQILPDHPQHPLAPDRFPDPAQQDVMVHVIEGNRHTLPTSGTFQIG
jgi:site-specific DNA recombinase